MTHIAHTLSCQHVVCKWESEGANVAVYLLNTPSHSIRGTVHLCIDKPLDLVFQQLQNGLIYKIWMCVCVCVMDHINVSVNEIICLSNIFIFCTSCTFTGKTNPLKGTNSADKVGKLYRFLPIFIIFIISSY